jgi:phage shock protein A
MSPGQSAPDDPRTVRALESAIEALREQLVRADQREGAERGRAERAERHLEDARKRVDELQTALADAVAAERIAAGEATALRAEVERWRHMGWLQRIFSRVR